jgi:hypothetical protein
MKKELGRWAAAGPGRRDGPRVGKMGQAGPRGKRKRKEGEKRGFDLFFKPLSNHFSKPFLNQTFYTNFCKLFTNLFHNYF